MLDARSLIFDYQSFTTILYQSLARKTIYYTFDYP